MGHPLKCLRKWRLWVFLGTFSLELIMTLIAPNPFDVMILVGMILIFLGCFEDDFC